MAALESVKQLSESDKLEFLEGQRRFINDFAGELDGRASSRVIAMVQKVLEGGA